MGLSWRLVSSPRAVRFIYFTLLVTDLHKIGILPPLSLLVELGDSLPSDNAQQQHERHAARQEMYNTPQVAQINFSTREP